MPQQVDVNLAVLDRLNAQLRLNGEYQLRAMERRERLEHQLADRAAGAPAVAPTPASQVAKLREQLRELRGKFSEQYPDVIRLKGEIEKLEGQQENADSGSSDDQVSTPPTDSVQRVTEQSLAQVQSDLTSLKSEAGLLRRLITDYEARVENAPKRQEELQQLSRGSDTSKDRYDTLLKRYEEAQLAENLEQGQNVELFRVLDPAVVPTAPSAPNTLWLLLVGFAASVALAFAAVVAAERLDTSFHTADDLRAFVSVPTLAVIRRIPTQAAVRGQRIRFALTTIAIITGLALMVGGAHYVGSGNEQIVRLTARGRG
jgi:uncharacterized protein involved in exopolysaccharide biosynthesis